MATMNRSDNRGVVRDVWIELVDKGRAILPWIGFAAGAVIWWWLHTL